MGKTLKDSKKHWASILHWCTYIINTSSQGEIVILSLILVLLRALVVLVSTTSEGTHGRTDSSHTIAKTHGVHASYSTHTKEILLIDDLVFFAALHHTTK